MAVVDPSASGYTVVMAQTTIVNLAAVQTAIEVLVVPPVSVTMFVVPFDDILPSHSTCPMFFPGVDNLHENP